MSQANNEEAEVRIEHLKGGGAQAFPKWGRGNAAQGADEPKVDELLNKARQPTTAPTHDEFIAALKQAEEGLAASQLRVSASTGHINRLERQLATTQEQLALRDQEVQALTRQLEAQTDSTTIWHGKCKQAIAAKQAFARELRVILADKSESWRFFYRILRNRALHIEAKQEVA